MTDDRSLIARALGGDLASYGELVGRHQYAALRVAAAVAGREVAEDAAQEAMVRAYRALPSFDLEKPFRPWLLAIVANTARNQRRSGDRWAQAAALSATLHPRSPASIPDPVDVAVARASTASLLEAVERLPLAQREVVACRYLMDLTEQETAEALAIPRGTVKSRLARALARLERMLPAEGPHA